VFVRETIQVSRFHKSLNVTSSCVCVHAWVNAVPPQFVVEPRSQTVSQGQTVTLDCTAEGEPEPGITWRRGRTTLASSSSSSAAAAAAETVDPRITILHNNSLRYLYAAFWLDFTVARFSTLIAGFCR